MPAPNETIFLKLIQYVIFPPYKSSDFPASTKETTREKQREERERERDAQLERKGGEMVRPEMEDGRCKRHPKHLESIGVCPYCLQEALSRLLCTSSSRPNASPSSSRTSSSTYSSLCSFAVSPSYNDLKRPRPSFHFERSVEDRESVGVSEILTKSQSFVFWRGRKDGKIEKQNKGKEEKEEKKKEKKGRFWSNLLKGSKKGREDGIALLHSKASRVKHATKWFN